MPDSNMIAVNPHSSQDDMLVRLSPFGRIVTLLAVIVPFLGLGVAIAMLWGWGFSWGEFGLFMGMYLLTGLGITVGFHRLFTHRSFDTNPVVKAILGVLGSMAVQGPLLKWVAAHRRHHQHSDREKDPHTPHGGGKGWWSVIKGLCHAHMGWIFRGDAPHLGRYVRDLRQSRLLRWVSALFPVWVLAGLAIPTLLGFWIIGGWKGALLGLIWGGLVRIFFVHHVTWSVNSICHLWGQQPYPSSGDMSRNNFVVGVLAFGEGWHNNHHAFPTSARHGLCWWQIDISYWVIRALWLFGLAWNLKRPEKSALAA